MPQQGPSVSRFVAQWERYSIADLLNLDEPELREWLEDDYIFKAGCIIEEDEKDELVSLFSLIRSVAQQTILDVVSVEDVREMNSGLGRLFSDTLRVSPALMLQGISGTNSAVDMRWSVTAMHWAIAPLDDGGFVGSQVVDAIADVLGALAGERPYELKLCPAPRYPKQLDGGGTCGRFFLDQRVGRPRLTCSGACRERLSEWRKEHDRPEGFPAGP